MDELVFAHKTYDMLLQIIRILFHAFSCPNFVKYHKNKYGEFRFSFEQNDNLISIIQDISLPKNESIQLCIQGIQDFYNEWFETEHNSKYNYINIGSNSSINGRNRSNTKQLFNIECMNENMIYAQSYDMQITLRLLPGLLFNHLVQSTNIHNIKQEYIRLPSQPAIKQQNSTFVITLEFVLYMKNIWQLF